MDYQETMNTLSEMRSRYDAGFSFQDRNFLEKLNYLLFHERITVTGCANCYRDAYIIIYNKLKRLKAMPKPSDYCLRSGELLHEPGSDKYYVNDVPANIAEAFLKKYPSRIVLFARYPEDWETRIKKTSKKATETKVAEVKEPELPLNEENTEASK